MRTPEEQGLHDLRHWRRDQRRRDDPANHALPSRTPPRRRVRPGELDDDQEWDAPETRPNARPVSRAAPAGEPHRVVHLHREGCVVTASAGPRTCPPFPGLAVGDWVRVADGPVPRVTSVLPRRTVLSRPDPSQPRRERVLAANVDVVMHVQSIREPALRPGLIDRFLVAIARSGAEPLLCVNKADLGRDGDWEALRPYEALGIPVHRCSAATGVGIEALRGALAGRSAVLAGHSGVGKSSLLNALQPGLALAIGGVSEHTRKGRHTTTGTSLHVLDGRTCLIDTPGVREFGLWQVDEAAVQAAFPELAAVAGRCQFRDCRHGEEPGCAVGEAVREGRVQGARYAMYRRLVEETRV